MKVITIFDEQELEGVVKDIMGSSSKANHHHGRVLDCFIYNNNLYLVLEYFENGSLMDLVSYFLSRSSVEENLMTMKHQP